ncbi:MAG: MnmC family methyltransferase [Proteobacteria bacterium]|nr:MnmC family methyltransferase [Pseudomonadota bacterium]
MLAANDLSSVITQDGSVTFYSQSFDESFHSLKGAYEETMEKFIAPLECTLLQNSFWQKNSDVFRVLDVGLGMGYNSAAILDCAKTLALNIEIVALDISLAPLQKALQEPQCYKLFSSFDILHALEAKYQLHCDQNISVSSDNRSMMVYLQDGRKTIQELAHNSFHGVMFDPFSPKKCPKLWSYECLEWITDKLLKPGGRLVSYSVAAAFRQSLKDLGMMVYSIHPVKKSRKWSMATVAKKPADDKDEPIWLPSTEGSVYAPLKPFEQEHLLTKAAIPYHDPTLLASSEEILRSREQARQKSLLQSTTSWKKKWYTSLNPS